ncbi:Uncharacterised protein [Mycobacteroides abscessus subsp. abscessus]|nr:Uncharacterised protein [Mycobacteroides abscessus subsp. abscessus]
MSGLFGAAPVGVDRVVLSGGAGKEGESPALDLHRVLGNSGADDPGVEAGHDKLLGIWAKVSAI